MSSTIKIGGKVVVMTPTGFKIGSKGKVMNPSNVYGQIANKSERRQLRKFARSHDKKWHAACPTVAA